MDALHLFLFPAPDTETMLDILPYIIVFLFTCGVGALLGKK